MKKFTTLLILGILLNLYGEYQDIPITKDLNPNAKYDTFVDWRATHPISETKFEVRSKTNYFGNNTFLIVVEASIYDSVEASLNVYEQDLINENYNPDIISFSGNSFEDLKNLISDYYQNQSLKGTVLIGDLPAAWFELFEDWNGNGIQDNDESWVEFPCDLYLSDIDGVWEDQDEDGVFDYHEGEHQPEISIGRIKTNNLTMLEHSETALINKYFEKNHKFRTGITQANNHSLAYIDDDWEPWSNQYKSSMEQAYDSVELISNINETTRNDYRDHRITADYELIQVHAHSAPEAHYFYENNGEDYKQFKNYQIDGINPTAHFYNLFCCSNSRFTTSNNMGALYIHGSDYTLGTIGSTKTGSMLNFSDFYIPLQEGNSFGESLKLWWGKNVDTGEDWTWQRAWFYGMVFQGDPSLKKSYINETVLHVPEDYSTIQAAIDAAENNYTIVVADGTYYENLIIQEKALNIISENGKENCIIDGNQTGTVVTFDHSNNSTLDGFTIQNGLTEKGEKGGGIYCYTSPNVMLKNLEVKNNKAFQSAGVLFFNHSHSYLINSIIGNNEAELDGAGVICDWTSNVVIENTKIIENRASNMAGFYVGGGSNVVTKNLLIAKNISNEYAGIFIGMKGTLKMYNSTIVNNIATGHYSGIWSQDSPEQPIIYNSIIWGNYPTQIIGAPNIYYSTIQTGYQGEGNISDNPLFVDDDNLNYAILGNSPCVDTGIEDTLGFDLPDLDLVNETRIYDGDGDNFAIIDMGAYEYVGDPVSTDENLISKTNNIYLYQNYPNPLRINANRNKFTTFKYELQQFGNVKLCIYNLKGQLVEIIINKEQTAGLHKVNWNAQNLSTGFYFYKLNQNSKSQVKKMLLIK